MPEKYWTEEDEKILAQAKTNHDLFVVAERILKRMRQPVGMVCGPITTGGTGDVEANLKRLESMILGLQEHGLELFNQVPFQLQMHKIKEKNGDDGEEKLLNEFYLPLFEEHLIQTLYFLPGWETSNGARWEYEQAKRLSIQAVYLR